MSLLDEFEQEKKQPSLLDQFEQDRKSTLTQQFEADLTQSPEYQQKVQQGISQIKQLGLEEPPLDPHPIEDPVNLALMTTTPLSLGGGFVRTALTGAGIGAGITQAQSLLNEGKLATPGETAMGAGVGAVLPTTLKAAGEIASPLVSKVTGAFSSKIKDVAKFKGVSPQQVNKELQQTVKEGISATRGEALDQIIHQSAQTPEGAAHFSKYLEEAAKKVDVPPVTGELYEQKIASNIHHDLTRLGSKVLSQKPLDEQTRISQQIVDAIKNQEVELTGLKPLMDKMGVDYTRLANEIKRDVSASGRTLNWYSRVAKELNAQFKGTEAEGLFDDLAKESQGNAVLNWMGTWYRNIDNLRRASLVTQLSTASRNIQTQIGRGLIEPFDTFVQGMINKNPKAAISESASEMMVLFGRMSKPQRASYMKALSEYPLEEARMLNTPVHEVAALDKYTKTINFFNRWQELQSRRIGYQMRLARNLERNGFNPFRADLNQVPEEVMKPAVADAVDFAMDMSFANRAKNQISQGVLNAYSQVPLLTQINPFPRFNFANAWQYMFDFTPAGFLRLVNKGTRQAIASGNTEALSRPIIGTALTALGVALRSSEYAGPKWYEVQIGDHTVDTRPMAPLNVYMFLGELIANPQNLTMSDYITMPIGMTRITGTGLVLVDLLRDRPRSEYNWKLLKDYSGAYLGGFSVPARTALDFAGGIEKQLGMEPQEAYYRDTEQKPLLGPFMANVPGLARQVPPSYNVFTGEPMQAQNPITKQLTGVNVKTRTPIEEEAKRTRVLYQSIYPKTGIPEADNMLQKYMGVAMKDMPDPRQEKMWVGIRQIDYEELPDAGKRIILRNYFKEARARAKNMLELNDPDLARQIDEKRMDKDEKELMQIYGITQ